MKLLLLNASANTGSTGRIAEEIDRLAQLSGYEVWMGYGRQYTANRKYAIMIKTHTSPSFVPMCREGVNGLAFVTL